MGDADTFRPRDLDRDSSAVPGRHRSIPGSNPNVGRSATTPTAAPSSTPAGRGTGATSSRRSMRRRQKTRPSRLQKFGHLFRQLNAHRCELLQIELVMDKQPPEKARLIIGMTGSTGAIFGVRLLEALKQTDIETHVIISKWAQRTIEHETNYTVEQVRALGQRRAQPRRHGCDDLVRLVSHRGNGRHSLLDAHARPASPTATASISCTVPRMWCSRSGASWYWWCARRHCRKCTLENMLKLSRMGVTMLPPMPAFYNHPQIGR